MTKLSDLLLPDADLSFPYGVEVDEESLTPPPGLKRIGILYRSKDGEPDELVIDVAITYGLAGVPVMVEIPSTETADDPAYLLSVAANIGVSLSLLPPDGEDGWEAYAERVGAFTAGYFRQQNFSHELHPVTSHVEYMIAAELVDMTAYAPNDAYVRARFHDKVSAERANALKGRIRDSVHEVFGGAEGWRSFAKAAAARIVDQVESNCREIAGSRTAAQPPGDA
jgi:hypothetical protein